MGGTEKGYISEEKRFFRDVILVFCTVIDLICLFVLSTGWVISEFRIVHFKCFLLYLNGLLLWVVLFLSLYLSLCFRPECDDEPESDALAVVSGGAADTVAVAAGGGAGGGIRL